jgi:hypothetical protein
MPPNGWRYEIEAECERLTVSHHRSLNGKQSPKIALKPLCFIPHVMVSCFINQIVKLKIILKCQVQNCLENILGQNQPQLI